MQHPLRGLPKSYQLASGSVSPLRCPSAKTEGLRPGSLEPAMNQLHGTGTIYKCIQMHAFPLNQMDQHQTTPDINTHLLKKDVHISNDSLHAFVHLKLITLFDLRSFIFLVDVESIQLPIWVAIVRRHTETPPLDEFMKTPISCIHMAET